MVIALVIVLLGLTLTAGLWSFVCAPLINSKRLETAETAARVAASLVTAVGIVTAGVLYVLEREWSPRFAVDVSTQTYSVRGDNDTAVVQATVAITNQGRTSQHINNIEIGATALGSIAGATPNQYGDLPGKGVFDFTSNRPKDINSGETDFAYFEIPVSCHWELVRVVVKVPQPPFNPDTPPGLRRVYQRKTLVSLAKACGSRHDDS